VHHRVAPAQVGRDRREDDRLADVVLDPVERHFDLRPAAIINALDLRRPIYRQTAAYGHFGRPDLDLPWERTDRAALLASEAGIAAPEPVSAA
jgi:S-adenosylmethionine synthetase